MKTFSDGGGSRRWDSAGGGESWLRRDLQSGSVVGPPALPAVKFTPALTVVDKMPSVTIFHQGGLNYYTRLCVKQVFCCCRSDRCHPHALAFALSHSARLRNMQLIELLCVAAEALQIRAHALCTEALSQLLRPTPLEAIRLRSQAVLKWSRRASEFQAR